MSKEPAKSSFHTPVLLKESIDALSIVGDGVYVDATFGGGGHSRPILDRITAKGRLFGFDQDVEAAKNVPENDRFVFVRANFRYLHHFMRYYNVEALDGVLADLGVSSHHLDVAARGFSYRMDARLDMRMNISHQLDAVAVLNEYSADRLQVMFSEYGEIRNARTLSQLLTKRRRDSAIVSVGDLVGLASNVARGDRQRYLAQVFQAIRIEVNDELGALKEFLDQAGSLLKPGGKMVVISYHSLEDRIVKRFFRTGNVSGKVEQDDFGHVVKVMAEISKKPILPTEEERKRNPRSMSAKMRIAQKLLEDEEGK